MMGSLLVGGPAQRFSHEKTSAAVGSGRFNFNRGHQPSYQLEAPSEDSEKISGLVAHSVETDAVIDHFDHDLVWRQVSSKAKGPGVHRGKGVLEDVGARLVEGENDIVDDVVRSDELFQIGSHGTPGCPQKALVSRKNQGKRKMGTSYRWSSSPSCIPVPYPPPL